MDYGPADIPIASREVVQEHAFNEAALDIYGDTETADEAIYIVIWALQRDAELLAQKTSKSNVWGVKVEATRWGPRVLVFYQFDDRKVYLLDIKAI